MTKVNLHATTDAQIWAEEFMRHKTKNQWALQDIDEGLMLAWFANCLCAQMDHDADLAGVKVSEAIGCTYATMCTYAMNGKDITKVEFPEIAETVQAALALEPA